MTAWFIKGKHNFHWHRKGKLVKIDLLDHGYVEFIEPWGRGKASGSSLSNDTVILQNGFEAGIIEAARQSTQGSFRGWERGQCRDDGMCDPIKGHVSDCPYMTEGGDKRLLNHLFTNRHMTPFEFSGMVIEVQAPVFVFREWHRHRTQSYNEMSARYSPLPDLHYVPERDNVVERAEVARTTRNKQQAGTGDYQLGPAGVDEWRKALAEQYERSEYLYQRALAMGVPKELARISMPVGHYSRMRASTNLRNWLAFMTLRCDPQAQWEIRQYADAVSEIIRSVFPRTHSLWELGKGPLP